MAIDRSKETVKTAKAHMEYVFATTQLGPKRTKAITELRDYAQALLDRAKAQAKQREATVEVYK